MSKGERGCGAVCTCYSCRLDEQEARSMRQQIAFQSQLGAMNQRRQLLEQASRAMPTIDSYIRPLNEAIHEIKEEHQRLVSAIAGNESGNDELREEIAQLRAELTPLKQRMESLIGELMVALSEVRNPRQRDYFDPSKLVVIKGIDQ